MKNLIKGILIGLSLVLLVAFATTSLQTEKSTGKVKQIQGLYVFFASEPVMETEYLGTVKAVTKISNSSEARLDAVIKKCKKKHPNAEAVVFSKIDLLEADAVKFK